MALSAPRLDGTWASDLGQERRAGAESCECIGGILQGPGGCEGGQALECVGAISLPGGSSRPFQAQCRRRKRLCWSQPMAYASQLLRERMAAHGARSQSRNPSTDRTFDGRIAKIVAGAAPGSVLPTSPDGHLKHANR